MTLEVHQVGVKAGCSIEGCAALLATAGVVSVTTAVVFGRVVVVGNIVYWLEEKGQCMRTGSKNPCHPRALPNDKLQAAVLHLLDPEMRIPGHFPQVPIRVAEVTRVASPENLLRRLDDFAAGLYRLHQ